LVEDKHLSRINSLSQILMAGSSILSPILGGFIYAFVDIKLFILINGISFLVSAAAELLIDFNFNSMMTDIQKKKIPVIASLKEGWQYVINHSLLAKLIVFFVVVNFLFSFSAILPLPYILNNHIGISTGHFGITQSMMPIGMIIGAVCVGMVVKKLGFARAFYSVLLISFILMGFIGVPLFLPAITANAIVTLIYFSALLLGFGISISLIDVPVFTMLQKTTEEAYRGRVISLTVALAKIISPVAYLISGLLINRVNPYILPLAGSLVAIVYILVSRKSMLNLDSESTDETEIVKATA